MDDVEKLARALCAARWAGKATSLWDKLGEDEQEDYRRMARAAIEVMREKQ